MKKLFDLQMYSEEPVVAPESETAEKVEEQRAAAEKDKESTKSDAKPDAKYTDEDLDRIIGQKLAKWKEREQKAVEEAKKLAEMNATQKAEYERDQLKKELDELKRKDALAEMTKVARKMLNDKEINVPDELLSMMVTTDAQETKTAIDGFTKLYSEAVETAVKARLRGEAPRVSSAAATPISEIEKRIKKYV